MNALGRLMRFDKPVGIALLWAPTAWALWLVHKGMPSLRLLIYFFLGTVLMRAAGCVFNDIVDRHIDGQVSRTKQRPLATGEVSLLHAKGVLAILLGLAGLIVLELPKLCWLEACIALAITAIYPFCKRFLHAPQLVLGLAFSMGIPMAFAASGVSPNRVMFILMLLNFLWIIAYDTLYALIDRKDDLRIGVHSTAILFGSKLPLVMVLLQVGFHGLWLVEGITDHLSGWFDFCWVMALGILNYQHTLLKRHHEKAYMSAFLWHAGYGLLMWIALF